jgi:methyl-accepting chemotaxis protein
LPANQKQKKFRSINQKMTALILSLISGCLLLASILAFFTLFNEGVKTKGKLVSSIVLATAKTIDPSEFVHLSETGVENDYYYNAYQTLKEIRESTGATMLYSMTPAQNEDGYYYVIDSMLPEDNPDFASELGDFEPLENYTSAPLDAMRQNKVAATRLYDGGEPYGYLVSAFAPIIDESGKAVGILGADVDINDITASMTSVLLLLLSIFAFTFILAVIIARTVVKRNFERPMAALTEAACNIANGNLEISLNILSNDEFGFLCNNFKKMSDMIHALIKNTYQMLSHYNQGDLDARVASEGLQGAYLQMAEGINNMADSMNTLLRAVLGAAHGFGEGNFKANLPAYPGKKAIVNEAIDMVSTNLELVNKNIRSMIQAAVQGQLSVRMDSSNCQGGWAEIIEGLNKMMNAVTDPIDEAREILTKVSGGNLEVLVRGDYHGDFNQIKVALNSTIATIKTSIRDISSVLNGISGSNLDQIINSEYRGDFNNIKTSINKILDMFNSVIGQMKTASGRVNDGAGSISHSAMSLAAGAANQAASLELLSGSAQQISEKTLINVDDARLARDMALSSRKDAIKCQNEMSALTSAMDDIRKASQDIAGIIQVINNIAFQTKLLSLNAAVEAARAGTQGKGFAVVAEEVRNLSDHSKRSADETGELIQTALKKVSFGVNAANTTAGSLAKIIEEIDFISGLTGKIAEASDEQSQSIGQINEQISQISIVVQKNTAASEESAAAASELKEQSDRLNTMVSAFRLRN